MSIHINKKVVNYSACSAILGVVLVLAVNPWLDVSCSGWRKGKLQYFGINQFIDIVSNIENKSNNSDIQMEAFEECYLYVLNNKKLYQYELSQIESDRKRLFFEKLADSHIGFVANSSIQGIDPNYERLLLYLNDKDAR